VLKVHHQLYAPPSPLQHFMGMSLRSNLGPTFTLIPRQSALAVIPKSGVNKTFDSLSYILSTHGVSLSRGHTKTIFGDPNERVMYKKCLGVHPGRNSTGVLDCDKWAERIDGVHWRRVIEMVNRAELLFDMFAEQEVISIIYVWQRKLYHLKPCMLHTTTVNLHTFITRNISVPLHLAAMFFFDVTRMTTSQ
jgi:hypothetical protein